MTKYEMLEQKFIDKRKDIDECYNFITKFAKIFAVYLGTTEDKVIIRSIDPKTSSANFYLPTESPLLSSSIVNGYYYGFILEIFYPNQKSSYLIPMGVRKCGYSPQTTSNGIRAMPIFELFLVKQNKTFSDVNEKLNSIYDYIFVMLMKN